MSDLQLQLNNRCFGCGADNPIGLHLRPERQDGQWVVRLVVPEDFQGWADVAHGGFLCTVMDEVMSWSVRDESVRAVTGRLHVRFHKPVPVGAEITARGRVVRRRRRLIDTEASIELPDGSRAAEAHATFVVLAQGAAT
jgi:uncharacterized protein (TIGR00369 family)